MTRYYTFLLFALIFLFSVFAGYFLPNPLLIFPPSDFGLEPISYPNPYVALKEISIIGFLICIMIFIYQEKEMRKNDW